MYKFYLATSDVSQIILLTQVIMEKGTLKLKLKLGSTPEPPPMEEDSNVSVKSEGEDDQEKQVGCCLVV